MAALYTSGSVEGAWREAQQGFVFKMQPMTVCAYDVDCDDIADLTDPPTCSSLRVEPSDIACSWKDLASRGLTPPSWDLARRLFETGFVAVVVPSFAPAALAPAALASDWNMVFWRWADAPPHQVRVVDDERRLPRDTRSWTE